MAGSGGSALGKLDAAGLDVWPLASSHAAALAGGSLSAENPVERVGADERAGWGGGFGLLVDVVDGAAADHGGFADVGAAHSRLLPQLLSILAMLVPSDALSTVEKMIGSLLEPHRGMLSFGILSYIWSVSGGFTALITALNVAYDVTAPRSWVRDRAQALILALTSGGLLTVSMLALIAGPHFGHFLVEVFPVPRSFERMWPLIRIATVFVTFVVALELVYFLAPNRKQRFKSTLPGAIVAIGLWFVGSAGLAFYLNHLAHYSRMYGGMGAIIGLMFWVYLTALAILIGAELNAELAKRWDSLFRGHLKATERERMAAEKGLLRKRPAA